MFEITNEETQLLEMPRNELTEEKEKQLKELQQKLFKAFNELKLEEITAISRDLFINADFSGISPHVGLTTLGDNGNKNSNVGTVIKASLCKSEVLKLADLFQKLKEAWLMQDVFYKVNSQLDTRTYY